MGIFSVRAQHRGLKAAQQAAQLGVVGILIRFAAKLIDLVVMVLLIVAAVATVGLALTAAGVEILADGGPEIPLAYDAVVTLLFLVAFLAPSEAIAGCSLGKLAFRLRVVKDDGSPCTWLASVLRNVLFHFDSLFLILLAVMDSPMNQRLGDMLARTVVISTKKTQLERTWPIKKSLLGLLASYATLFVVAAALFAWLFTS